MALVADPKYTGVVSAFHGLGKRQLRVGKTVTASFRQIGDAVLASQPYDRIVVECGTYFESITITHPLELCSAKDSEAPIIVSVGPCVTINTDGPFMLQGFTINAKGTRASDSQAVVVQQGNPRIEDCDITSLHVKYDSKPHVLNCRIRDCRAGVGLSITGKSGGIYENNHIFGHDGESVYIDTTEKVVMRHNRITERKGRCGVVVHISGRVSKHCEPLLHDNIINGGSEAVGVTRNEETVAKALPTLLSKATHDTAVLVRVSHGATPALVSNLLCNGVNGFSFHDCTIPPNHFCGNRVGSCNAWGVVIVGNTTLIAEGNDIQSCSAGIYVCIPPALEGGDDEKDAGDSSEHAASRVRISRCNLQWNIYYGIVINRSVVSVSGCSVAEASVGLAFLGDCTGSTVAQNLLERNSVAGISALRRGSVVVGSNTIRGSTASMYGVLVQENSHCILQGMKIEKVATGVYVCDKGRITMEGNTINEVSVHHVVVEDGSQGSLTQNTLQGSGAAAVVVTSRSECHLVENYVLIGQKEGILVEKGAKATIEKNNLSSMREVVYVTKGSSAIVRNNDIVISNYGVVVYGEGSSSILWGNNFRSMTGPVVYALQNGTINITKNNVVGSQAVCMQVGSGGTAIVEECTFKNCTSGVAHADGSDTLCSITKCSIERVGYGLRYTGLARGNVEDNDIAICAEYALSCESHSPVVVKNNRITDSAAGLSLFANGQCSELIIKKCKVGIIAKFESSANLNAILLEDCGTGIIIERGALVSIASSIITNCRKYGIKVKGASPKAVVSETTIENCKISGVAVFNRGACLFEKCAISKNDVHGVLLNGAGDTAFVDCVIAQQKKGVVVSSRGGAANSCGAMRPIGERGKVMFLNCTIEGGNCVEGVSAVKSDTILHLEKCQISAGSSQGGIGVVVKDHAVVWMVQCDVTQCTRSGIATSPLARLLAEQVVVEDCRVGVIFESPADDRKRAEEPVGDKLEETLSSETMESIISWESRRRLSMELVLDTLTCVSLRKLTVNSCKKAGVWFMPRSIGELADSSVSECAIGIVAEHGSTTMLRTVDVRRCATFGALLHAWLSKKAEVDNLTVVDSCGDGVKVSVGPEMVEDEDMGSLTIKNSEMSRNGGCGVVLSAQASLEECIVSGNQRVGVVCEGATSQSTCRQRISACHLDGNKESNLVITGNSVPELYNCTFSGSNIGLRVESAVDMRECALYRHQVAVLFAHSQDYESDSEQDMSVLQSCVVKENDIGVSCAFEGRAIESGVIHIDKCAFDNITNTGVQVQAGPLVLMTSSSFTASKKAVTVTERGKANVEECTFTSNVDGMLVRNALQVEVSKSVFLRCVARGLIVEGECGEVRINYNHFKQTKEHGIYVSAGETRVFVNENIFGGDGCGVVMEDSTTTYLYNNVFSKCGTGVVLLGDKCSGTVVGNLLVENDNGCICERGSRGKIWKNEFSGNKKCGLMTTVGSNPVVVDNTFRRHTTDRSYAVCVHREGVGHFTNNQFMENACGVYIGSAGGIVSIYENMFNENGVCVRLDEGASTHVVACSFLNSSTAGVHAVNRIECSQCVFAYNFFSMKKGTAVLLEEEAAVILFRSLVSGTGGRGVCMGKQCSGVVHESLFQELECGIYLEDYAEGRVVGCVFLNCPSMSEVAAHAKTVFYKCLTFIRSCGSPAVLLLKPDAEPLFSRCEVSASGKSPNPLLLSQGGGAVEDCVFSTGSVAITLDNLSSTKIRRSRFLRGEVGVAILTGCAATLEGNQFDVHDRAAVKIANNAGGVMKGNGFAQPIDGGAIVAGTHNVVIEECRQIGGLSKPDKVKRETMACNSVEKRMSTAFAGVLKEAPARTRSNFMQILGARRCLPVVLEVLKAVEEEEAAAAAAAAVTDDNTAATQKEGMPLTLKKNLELKQTRTPSPGPRRTYATPTRKGRKTGKNKRLLDFKFTPNDSVVRVSEDARCWLLAWMEQNDIELIFPKEEEQFSNVAPMPMLDNDTLQKVEGRLCQMKEALIANRKVVSPRSPGSQERRSRVTGFHTQRRASSVTVVSPPPAGCEGADPSYVCGSRSTVDVRGAGAETESCRYWRSKGSMERLNRSKSCGLDVTKLTEAAAEQSRCVIQPPLFSTDEVLSRAPPKRDPPVAFTTIQRAVTPVRELSRPKRRRRKDFLKPSYDQEDMEVRGLISLAPSSTLYGGEVPLNSEQCSNYVSAEGEAEVTSGATSRHSAWDHEKCKYTGAKHSSDECDPTTRNGPKLVSVFRTYGKTATSDTNESTWGSCELLEDRDQDNKGSSAQSSDAIRIFLASRTDDEAHQSHSKPHIKDSLQHPASENGDAGVRLGNDVVSPKKGEAYERTTPGQLTHDEHPPDAESNFPLRRLTPAMKDITEKTTSAVLGTIDEPSDASSFEGEPRNYSTGPQDDLPSALTSRGEGGGLVERTDDGWTARPKKKKQISKELTKASGDRSKRKKNKIYPTSRVSARERMPASMADEARDKLGTQAKAKRQREGISVTITENIEFSTNRTGVFDNTERLPTQDLLTDVAKSNDTPHSGSDFHVDTKQMLLENAVSIEVCSAHAPSSKVGSPVHSAPVSEVASIGKAGGDLLPMGGRSSPGGADVHSVDAAIAAGETHADTHRSGTEVIFSDIAVTSTAGGGQAPTGESCEPTGSKASFGEHRINMALEGEAVKSDETAEDKIGGDPAVLAEQEAPDHCSPKAYSSAAVSPGETSKEQRSVSPIVANEVVDPLNEVPQNVMESSLYVGEEELAIDHSKELITDAHAEEIGVVLHSFSRRTSSSDIVKSEKSMSWEGIAPSVESFGRLSTKGRAMLATIRSEVLAEELSMCEDLFDGVVASGHEKRQPGSDSHLLASDHEDIVSVPTNSESELEESIEDIVALLRWLASLRQQRRMDNESFTRAVDCVRDRAMVPFFLCEGTPSSGGPTVMVRLPQTADEVVVIPLLGSERTVVEIVRGAKLPTTNSCGQAVAPHLKHTGGEGEHTAVKVACGSLPQLLYRKAVPRGTDTEQSAHTPPSSVGLPKLTTHQKLQGIKSALPMLQSSAWDMQRKRKEWATSVDSPEANQEPFHASTTKARVKVSNNGRMQRKFIEACLGNSKQGAVAFNPANPMGTSPYCGIEKIATFINGGMSNVML